MKFGAAYRSLFETATILVLTRILSVNSFASLMDSYYPIYFVANVFFSASTVDFAGGQRQTALTKTLFIPAASAILIFWLLSGDTFRSLFFLVAGLTALESVAFVLCESLNKRRALLLMLVPRALLAVFCSLILVLGIDLSLEDAIRAMFARDIVAVLIGISVLWFLRSEFLFKIGILRARISEIVYLLVSNSNDFVLRVVLTYLIGPGFLKGFEYALRLPRIAQVGLMLALRHRLFALEGVSETSDKVLLLQSGSGLAATLVFAAYQCGFSVVPLMVIVTSMLVTTAVPWYTHELRRRNFLFLTVAQVVCFGATVVSAIEFEDAYVSTFSMALILFLFSFACEAKRKFALK